MQQARTFSVLLLAAFVAAAQLSTSTIRGHVSDPTGAVVAGAGIKLVNIQTAVEREVTTNNDGDFEIPDLQRGRYRVTVSHSGFRNFIADNIVLETSTIRRVDATLELGSVGAEVTVQANAAVIETDSAKIQGSFTKQRFEEAPWIGDGRNPQVIMATLPLVQMTSGVYGIQVAGLAGSQTQTAIDGLGGDGTSLQTANVHVMQDVNIVVGNNSAEFSRPGYINMTTKGGGNQWHGTAAYWHQNSALAARNFFDAKKPSALFHTYHGELSGPAIKDRLFFFVSLSGQNWPGGNYILRDVPTALMRQGDFSEVLPRTVVRDPLNNTPFANNRIPSSRLNPVAGKIFDKYLPAPNLGGPGQLSNNYGFLFPYPTDLFVYKAYEYRADYRINSKNTIYGRVILSKPQYVLAGNYPGLAWTRVRDSRNVVVEDTHIFSPTLVNTVRFGWYQPIVNDGGTVDGFNPVTGDAAVKELGIQGVNPQSLSGMGFPTVSITGYQPIRVNPAGSPLQNDILKTFTDAATWSRGAHTLKIGGELRLSSNLVNTIPEGTYGNFSFTGQLSGYAPADFYLGYPFSSVRLNPLTNRTVLDRELGLYVNDTWKINSRLTLDWGLRWDRFGSPNYDDGKIYNWDPVSGNVVIPSGAQISPLYPVSTIKVVTGDVRTQPTNRNFQPRIGIAWRPLGPNWVVRGGYAVFTEQIGRFARANGTGPFQLSETFFNNAGTILPWPNPFPAGAGAIASQSVAGYPLGTENGRLHQFNATIERQIGDVGLRASYQGTRAYGLNYNIGINIPQPSLTPFAQSRRPYPQYVGATLARNNGEQKFNAATLEAQRKVGMVTFDVHWTLASNYWNYQNLENPYAPLFWERDPNTVRQRFVINSIFQVPVGKGKRVLSNAGPVAEQIVGGWQIYWTGFMETGQFFGPSFSGADPSNTNTTSGRPDRLTNGNLSTSERRLNRWFDPAAFARPVAGRFGNSGTNVLEGPGLNQHNLTIGKTFPITERIKFTFMAAAQNIANHASFNNPAANINASNVGVISGTRQFSAIGGSRQIMLRGRVTF
ncbi:MAG: carboxypeptidase regulatory-like domain-containing protein [Bryobacteraceae bacterium]